MANEMKLRIADILQKPQKDGSYKRVMPTGGRFQVFRTMVADKLGILCLVNLFILIFCSPMIGLIVFRSLALSSGTLLYPFGGGLGVGYPASPDLTGAAESLRLNVDLIFFGGLFVASFLAALGLAGGSFVIRNMIRTNGDLSVKDFWRGISKHYLPAMQSAALVTLFLFLTSYVVNLADFLIASGSDAVVWLVISKVAAYILLALGILFSLWTLALGVNFKQGFFALYKNAFLLLTGTFPLTLVYAVLALAPVLLLFLGGFFTTIAIFFYVMFGVVYALMVWFSFVQWVIDQYTGKEGISYEAEKNAKPAVQPKAEDKTKEKEDERRRMILSRKWSYLDGRPMMKLDEGKSFDALDTLSRESLAAVKESQTEVLAEADEYAKAHSSDAAYAEYNKIWNEREKVLPETKKKKRSAPRMLNGR
ncbi:MAG: hypothetical protein J6D37_04195 [Clostridia bacterium]|nr:hypothetical protein [Clostridia bacterium]